MKNIRKQILYMIAIAIVTLLITSTSSLPIKQASPQEDEIQAKYLVVQSQPLLKTKTIENSIQPLFSGSIPITGGNYNEYHPSVARSPTGGFYAMVEESADGSIWQPTVYRSNDGIAWEPILTMLFDNAEYTDMDQNAYGTYGTFGAPSDESSQVIIVEGEIEDGWLWDYSAYNFNEFSNNRIACYTFEGPEGDPGTWNWGGVAFTGYQGSVDPPIVGCPFIFYQFGDGGSGLIGWLTGDVSGCEHVGSTMDLAKNIMYSVYDRNNGTGWELLLRKDNFGIWNPSGPYWTHPNMMSKHITNPTNLTYPSVAAYDNTVIVACQKGNDIIVYYSNDGFSTYQEVLVQSLASYPEVAITAQGKAFITYIKDNVLYYRTSDSGGATWSNAQIVSDNQVNLNDRAANLDEMNGNIFCTWEDTRDANINAYFDIIYGTLNNPPVFGIPSPANGSTNNPSSFPWSIPINDPEGDLFSWTIQCSNGETSSGTSETNGTKSLVLSDLAYSTTYKVWVNATDPTGSNLYERKWYTFITNTNRPPSRPVITGPATGKVGIVTYYNFTATDPNNDEVYYFIDWGDQTNSSWIGPYSSGDLIIKSHIWSKKGDYTIKAKAKDNNGKESDWGTLSVKMPFLYNIPLIQFWERLLERFPYTFPILRHLLGY